MTNYDRGRAVEYGVRDALTELGCWPVLRMAGSKGVCDLIAALPDRTLAVQVKRECWPSPTERFALSTLASLTAWEAWACRWTPRQPLRWARIRFGGELDERGIR